METGKNGTKCSNLCLKVHANKIVGDDYSTIIIEKLTCNRQQTFLTAPLQRNILKLYSKLEIICVLTDYARHRGVRQYQNIKFFFRSTEF